MPARVIFDVATGGYPNRWYPCFAVVGTGAFVAVALAIRRRSPRHAAATPVSAIIAFAAFPLLVNLQAFISSYRDYRQLRSALLAGHYETVDGVITDFVPGGFGDHPPESFTVAGHRYWYSFATVRPGYHRPRWLGGVLRNGLHVRIADVNGEIARLEVMQ